MIKKTPMPSVPGAALLAATAAAADCPVKVGVLHSLPGSMAISETTLRDVMLMLIDQQNAKGGVLGCQIEPVVVDPASDWLLFTELTRQLLTVDEVDVIFGALDLGVAQGDAAGARRTQWSDVLSCAV